jgi:putative hydrolase
VQAAREKGLRAVGIADHGPGHVFFGMKRSRFQSMRQEIDRLNLKYADIDIFMGVEANIVNPSGRLDILPSEFDLFDFVIAGYHYGVLGENPLGSGLLHGGNMLCHYTGWGRKRLRARNTALIEKALYTNDFKMLTHPGDKGPVDLAAVAAACANTDTLLEINTQHDCLSAEDIKTAARVAGLRFAVSSDAHTPGRVGDFMPAVELALRAGLDLSRIVNLERVEN